MAAPIPTDAYKERREDKMEKKRIIIGGFAYYAIKSVSATTNAAAIIANVICSLVPDLLSLARVIAILFFIYGGAKFAFAADDPGGRKQGKQIAIHALIGFIIVAASEAIVQAISGVDPC